MRHEAAHPGSEIRHARSWSQARVSVLVTLGLFGSFVAAAPLPAGAQALAIALDGELAPGTGGGDYTAFGVPSINESGDVAFRAKFVGGGGPADDGIFLREPSGALPLALGVALLRGLSRRRRR